MKRFFAEMNPALRGFLIIGVIVLAIVFLRPAAITFAIVWIIARILFMIAIAYLVYRWWREHRGEISLWSSRAKWTFYGGAALIVVELLLATWPVTWLLGIVLARLTFLAWVLGIAIAVYAMWVVWRDEHTYE